MQFDIKTTEKKNTALVQVQGDVDMYTSPSLRDILTRLFKKNVNAVVVDMTKVSFMDSSGIATLVEGLQWSRKQNRQFILAGLGDTVYNALSLTKLDNVFTIHENVHQAYEAITEKNMKET
ncbi:MAG TPA: STAS domain-containing protein [Desulfotignum sp.]|nr:STAS domain-containing protein [Desulfotignum sp.]